jgi:hypothetical protein
MTNTYEPFFEVAGLAHEDVLYAKAAIPSPEAVRRAERLRAILREKYLGRPQAPLTVWCVGVD